MQATGIVRRIDDLGRVVIPKEIRRNFKIKDGDPLELFIEKDSGMICLKKYQPYDDEQFKKAFQMVKAIIPCGLAILDSNEEYVIGNSAPVKPYVPVYADGDIVCYIGGANAADYSNLNTEFTLAAKVIGKYFEED